MLHKFFQSFTKKKHQYSCEKTGDECVLEDTKVLTRINAVFTTKHMKNIRVMMNERKIYSDTKPPISFYAKMELPRAIENTLGETYFTIADENDIEETTALLAEHGKLAVLIQQTARFAHYFENNDRVEFPETHFFFNVSDLKVYQPNATCQCCHKSYYAVNNKYRFKKILETKQQAGEFGNIGIIFPGFDSGVSDISDKNRKGTYYFFKTDKAFNKVNLCSNECAVEYCKINKVAVYFNDFINGGKLRMLVEQTPQINEAIKNSYKYRSSNL